MELNAYKLFALTAETENISKTAELSGYTQSNVSHILKSMEKEVGVALFKRDRYGVHLTPIGREFLPYVKSIIKEEEKLIQFVNDIKGYEVGTLVIGSFTSISVQWLPDILEKFHEIHPGITIRLREGGSEEIHDWIDNHEVDLAFCSKQRTSFDFFLLMNDPIVAILPKDSKIAQKKSAISIADFENVPFILQAEGIDYDIHNMLKQYHVNPDIRFSSYDEHAILSMVEHHLGVSLLPSLCIKGYDHHVLTLPLKEQCARELGIEVQNLESASPIARKFLYFIQEYFNTSFIN